MFHLTILPKKMSFFKRTSAGIRYENHGFCPLRGSTWNIEMRIAE